MADDWRLFREWTRGQGDLERYLKDLARPGALTAGLNWYRAAFMPLAPDEAPLPAVPAWDRVKCPTLGIWSDGDPFLLEPQIAMSAAAVDAPWRYERVSGAGHWLMLDQPGPEPVPAGVSPRVSRRVAVIGAGAAGTMAAIFSAAGGAETLLLERTRDGGRKILISGGGRCNILPARVDERRFVTDSSPHTLRNILRSWPLAEQIAFFEGELGLTLVEERETAKLFPASNRSRDVRDGLLALAHRRGAHFLAETTITSFEPVANGWRVERERAEPLVVDAVIVATGGLSVPNTGSDGGGLAILAALGHTVHPTCAALTPALASPAPFAALAGVSLPVTITARDSRRNVGSSGGFLFTHRGYSGPSVLDVSHVLVRSRLEGDASARLLVQWTGLDEAA